MTKLQGGTRVRKGYYLRLSSLSFTPVSRDGEPLPGSASERYWHLPVPLVVLLGPALGAAYVVVLPFIGFYLVARAVGRKALSLARRAATQIAAVVAPALRPGEAHLAGARARDEDRQASGSHAALDELSRLEAEIARRRGQRV